MAILTPEELIKYLPSLSLAPIQAEGIISRAQGIAESNYGANRTLEKTFYTETKQVLADGELRLSNFPLVEGEPISIEVKDPGSLGYGGMVAQSHGWRVLDPEAYRVDCERNLIEVISTSVYAYAFSTDLGGRGARRYPLHRPEPPQAKVRYSAGFDFNPESQNPDVKKMKSALAGIIELMSNKASRGVKREVSDDDEIEYFSPKEQQDINYLNYLTIFKRYCPRNSFS